MLKINLKSCCLNNKKGDKNMDFTKIVKNINLLIQRKEKIESENQSDPVLEEQIKKVL